MIACAARMVGSKVIFFSFLLYSHSQYINIFPSKEKRACLKLWDTHKQYHPPNFQTKHHFQVYTCTLKKRILTIPLKQTLLFKDFTLPGRRGVYSPLLAKYLLTRPPHLEKSHQQTHSQCASGYQSPSKTPSPLSCQAPLKSANCPNLFLANPPLYQFFMNSAHLKVKFFSEHPEI